MIGKNKFKNDFKKAMVGLFLAIITIFTPVIGTITTSQDVYADPPSNTAEVQVSDLGNTTEDNCQTSLGPIAWLVCPTTGKIAEAVDWLYEKIENILTINPVSAENNSPIYEIWKYCRGITNIVFIIFLLIVIYSQITGLGISNYGVKKSLPKLIIAAILVNLSFLICSLAVDVSNIVGSSLREVFSSIAESAVIANSAAPAEDVSLEMKMSYSSMYSSLAGGTALAVGAGAIAFEAGAIWMLIPVVLGALVAVASGLITIALRQAVVALLIMISPLAMVANILPNTEQWFKKWKELLFKMLIFYPMFSLLFGASNLAGFAIIVSAQDGFTLLLGVAVQIFPLFFSWSLMRMSGTFLGTINAKIRGLADRPLAMNRAWADSRRQVTRQRFLTSDKAYTPSLRLRQFLENRKIAREAEISESEEYNKKRGLAYYRSRRYARNGASSRLGVEAYRKQANKMKYDRIVARDDNNMNRGLGDIAANKRSPYTTRIRELDKRNIAEADMLTAEKARGEKIDFENAMGFHERMDAAMNVYMDSVNGYENGKPLADHKFHFEPNSLKAKEAMARYNAMYQIMDNNLADVHYVAATAAQGYDTQKKIVETKMQTYFGAIPATKDVVQRLNELTKLNSNDLMNGKKAIDNIDAIVTGMRILNQRGDTDLVKEQLDNILDKKIGGGLELGTHASQALASFLMFEVKDNDPFLRRFGKYINLETAAVYNKNKRKELDVTYDEYIKGYHIEPDGEMMASKKPMVKLVEGTSLDSVERTAFSNLDDSLKRAYGYNGKDGNWEVEKWLNKRKDIQTAFEPAFLSSILKYLSGSEQMNSAVKFWTGWEQRQKEENGKAVFDDKDNPVYEWKPVWEGKEFKGHEDMVKKYFRDRTYDYFKDQTVSQILNMRTDLREPSIEHLIEMSFEDDDKAVEGKRREDFEKQKAEIQTRYGDMDKDEAKKLRAADLKKLKMEVAGTQLRKILDQTGKLEQIYNMRRSGVTSGTKDWMRNWLNLDNKAEIFRYLAEKDREREAEKSRTELNLNHNDINDESLESGVIYNSDFKAGLMAELQEIYDQTDSRDDETFYQTTLEKLKKTFGEGSTIVAEYEKFKERIANADSKMCFDELDRLITEL